SAVTGSVAMSRCTNEVTPASRDLPSGNVCNHAPAADMSCDDQRLIKLSQARSRFAPSGKEPVHLLADCGSLAAQVQTMPAAAVACVWPGGSLLNKVAAWRGSSSAITEIIPGKSELRVDDSPKLSAQ